VVTFKYLSETHVIFIEHKPSYLVFHWSYDHVAAKSLKIYSYNALITDHRCYLFNLHHWSSIPMYHPWSSLDGILGCGWKLDFTYLGVSLFFSIFNLTVLHQNFCHKRYVHEHIFHTTLHGYLLDTSLLCPQLRTCI